MRSILEPRGADMCYACGAMGYLEDHHIFPGTANRKKSERAGLKAHLCYRCHRGSRTGVHGGNEELNRWLKQEAQRAYERTHTRAEFVALIGKNYLEAEDEEHSG